MQQTSNWQTHLLYLQLETLLGHNSSDKFPGYHHRIRSFSHDVTAAILVYQNNETAAILVYQTNPVGVKLFSYVKTFFCSNKFA